MESNADRKRKHITEHVISGFNNANEAIIFGNTIEHIIVNKLKNSKFRQSIGSIETKLAITEDYQGPTVLKVNFLEIDREAISFIQNKIAELVGLSNRDLLIEQTSAREKPQPQIINLNYAER